MNTQQLDLNKIMEFDHVIQVHEDGSISEPTGIYAPSLYDGELDDLNWSFWSTGYTNQYGYAGPILHNSEFIDGRLERAILSTPGMYAAVVNNLTGTDEVEGWAVVRYGAK